MVTGWSLISEDAALPVQVLAGDEFAHRRRGGLGAASSTGSMESRFDHYSRLGEQGLFGPDGLDHPIDLAVRVEQGRRHPQHRT